jgi:hypothetical protein
MPKLGTVALIGASGKRYEFSVYLREDAFKPLGAVYFLAKRIPFAEGEAEYTWIYVGESGDISQRPLSPKHKPCIDANEANSLCLFPGTSRRPFSRRGVMTRARSSRGAERQVHACH